MGGEFLLDDGIGGGESGVWSSKLEEIQQQDAEMKGFCKLSGHHDNEVAEVMTKRDSEC